MLSKINSIWEAKESKVRPKVVEAAWTKTLSAALGKNGPLDFSLEKKIFLQWFYAIMDHNGFERQTQDFPAIIKINWTNPALCIAWRVMLIFPLSYNLFRGL